MSKYVEVIVDIPVNEVDKIFHYKVPTELEDRLSIGQAVLLPFANRKIIGFIIGFTDNPGIEDKRIKNIIKVISNISFFDDKLLELFQWMSSYYKSNLIKIIRAAIPTGVLNDKVKEKKIKYAILNKAPEQIKEFIQKHGDKAYKQAKILELLLDKNMAIQTSELAKLASTSYGTLKRLAEKGIIKIIEEKHERRPFMQVDTEFKKSFKATAAQSKVINRINQEIQQNKQGAFLLHGVTGSGKTEVYLQVIEYALNKGGGAIVLVPEISLTPMMVKRFYSRFEDLIAVLHSNLSLGERYDEWLRLKRGEAKIAIGARSAIFAPVKNLSLIILDEEHETSYKQGDYPYYHAREIALKRSKILNATVILGSATPSLESYYFAEKDIFKYLSLDKRVNNDSLPPVKIIDMRDELKQGNLSIFSADLQKGISATLKKGEQVLIFLNRRGYANFILCRECGEVIRCQNCDISLTYHANNNHLKCHYCEYTINVPKLCPGCESKYLRQFGLGTERLEEELKRLYPQAKIDRMDVDTTSRKGSHRHILNRLESGETDILIGTQMVAKGHDYPNISLVGVISADTILNIPDFRSAERSFQLLTQVAGRTGRGDKKGKVIIQTYTPEHYSIKAAEIHDYKDFYQKEITYRKEFNYPPFSQMVNIIIQSKYENKVISASERLNDFLNNYKGLIHDILGPGPAAISKIQNRYRWQIILKFSGYKKRNYVLSEIKNKFFSKKEKDLIYSIDVDPQKML
ncbi:primosomal protein N' [Natronospora cellulosivora (SeqCode)]